MERQRKKEAHIKVICLDSIPFVRLKAGRQTSLTSLSPSHPLRSLGFYDISPLITHSEETCSTWVLTSLLLLLSLIINYLRVIGKNAKSIMDSLFLSVVLNQLTPTRMEWRKRRQLGEIQTLLPRMQSILRETRRSENQKVPDPVSGNESCRREMSTV